MPNKAILDLIAATIVILVLIGVGLCFGYLLWGSQYQPVKETFASRIEMEDGSRVLDREPEAKPELPEPEKPKGHKTVRTVEVTVSGGESVLKPSVEPQDCARSDDFTCPPVTVRLDLLRAPDGTLRAQASSSTGEILDGVDIPKEPILIPKERPWSVGYEQATDGTKGAFLSRDFGRITVGVSANQEVVTGRVGWRF